ncbi:MAG: hypothetical protein A2204_03365 [Elusimicrobia bacterium RIFOXYA1_FULL_47_7]|nr:MAG: hypothetical protein A2278_01110 [Elusimicrobia bacterium RIFOXYA12_FULL_49_49]OGS06632.1 MAG: hypothetical protein A2204_03365 [Elusimicrobia bacterium RIFOXYA1_FULL_47_7]OGS11082.1 MAG: hypothetical protein A2386_03670 [Elusimicrobia bacterium RIFOXYB1_FULL_48_9]OGS15796.1 MAG: hypothetical protein A2251_04010 [Elusimicrobia bacterium RIFOXYA2_FULL_47_53]OGS25984.1 MAG: hypothetical protein A2339_05400 [Elusimicrobia bacterium RIFOXYB12_FULL_50_12]OGS31128.1 MAG: hypothetical protein
MKPGDLNPNFASGHGIRQTLWDFFILKKLNRSHRYASSFLVKKASALFASVLAPNAKFGLNAAAPLLSQSYSPAYRTA